MNPSLTITAMAERAMALWPNAGQPDAAAGGRLEADYEAVAPIVPKAPVVPAGAPGELRLPVDLGIPSLRQPNRASV